MKPPHGFDEALDECFTIIQKGGDRLTPMSWALGVVNIGSGVATSTSEVVTLAREVSGRPLATTSKDSRDFDLPRVQLDISLLRSLVAYQPRSLQEGMRQVWADMSKEPNPGVAAGQSPRAR